MGVGRKKSLVCQSRTLCRRGAKKSFLCASRGAKRVGGVRISYFASVFWVARCVGGGDEKASALMLQGPPIAWERQGTSSIIYVSGATHCAGCVRKVVILRVTTRLPTVCLHTWIRFPRMRTRVVVLGGSQIRHRFHVQKSARAEVTTLFFPINGFRGVSKGLVGQGGFFPLFIYFLRPRLSFFLQLASKIFGFFERNLVPISGTKFGPQNGNRLLSFLMKIAFFGSPKWEPDFDPNGAR